MQLTGNVLTNDTGSGNPAASLTVINFTVAGLAGTFTAGQTASIPNVGTIQINSNGGYTFTPVANYNGPVPAIDYTATDTNGGSDIGRLSLSITAVNDPPVANSNTATTNEDNPVTGNVLTDGTPDSDVDPNTTLVVTQYSYTVGGVAYTYAAGATSNLIPGVGTIVINTNGSYTFTPASNYNGSAPAITYTISDGNGGTASSTLAITVVAVNDAPTAVNDSYTLSEDNTLTGSNLLSNDSDLETSQANLQVSQFAVGGVITTVDPTTGGTYLIPSVGTIQINANGTFSFTPLANYNGTVPTVTYTTRDEGGATATANLLIVVSPVNDPPVAVDDTATTNEDTPVTVNILSNDTDVENNTLTLTQFVINGRTYSPESTASLPEGTIQYNPTTRSFTFTPALNYTGTVPTVTYTVSDGNGGSDTGDLSITVNAVNDAPTPAQDYFSFVANDVNNNVVSSTTATGAILSNDSDQEGNTITLTSFTISGVSGTFNAGSPATISNVGTVTITDAGTLTFTPSNDRNGDGTIGDFFIGDVPVITYTISDGTSTATSTIEIFVNKVNRNPNGVNDSQSTNEDVMATGNVLTNDSDLDISECASDGVRVIWSNASGSAAYSTSTGEFDSNTILTAGDYTPGGGLVRTINSGYSNASISSVAAHDYAQAITNGEYLEYPFKLTTTTSNVYLSKFSFLQSSPTSQAYRITIAISSDNFASSTVLVSNYQIDANSSNGTKTVSVSPRNQLSTNRDYKIRVYFHGLAAIPPSTINDFDDFSIFTTCSKTTDVLAVSQISFTINSSTYTFPAGTLASMPGFGTIKVNSDGTYEFTPNANFNGIVPAITYTLADGNGGTATANLNLTVNPVNDAPNAINDNSSTPEDTSVSVNVLANDSDVDASTTLSVSQFTVSGISGTFNPGQTASIDGVGTITATSTGNFTFTPAANYSGSVPAITYTISDGNNGTATANLSITVTPVNDAPLAVDDAATTNEDTQVTVNVLSNDTDVENNTLTLTQFVINGTTYSPGSTASLTEGTIQYNPATGSFTFTPALNYTGTVPTVSYTITDGLGGTASANLVVTITTVNDVPIAANDSYTINEDTILTGSDLLANDSDVETARADLRVSEFTVGNVTTTVDLVNGGTYLIPNNVGTIQINAVGTFTFTPLANYNGTVPPITYTVRDVGGATATAILAIVVTPVNDPPVVVSETPSTPENTALSGNVLTDGTDDSDVDGNTLSISQFTINNTTYPAGSIVDLPNVGTVIVNADGTYTFTPVFGYFGAVPSIAYAVSDGNGGTTNGTLAITVTAVNDPPVVVSESIQIQEDAPATGNLLTNDTDPENNSLTISQFTIAGVSGTFTPGTTAVTIPNVGTIQISANGAYVFTPAANYNGIVPNIEYRVSDGQGAFANGNLTIVVAAVNDAPTVTNDTKSEPVNTPIVDNVLSNDRDIEGSALSLTKFTIGGVDYPAGTTATIVGVGTVVMNADGTYTFTPATNYIGSPPVITYTVSDGTATSTGTLSLSITPIDADGDGIPDATEKGTGATPRDSDNDGTPDYLDTDSDNDGIPDAAEDAACIGFLPCTPTDTDGDGTPDYRDLDSDGDGISDAIEGTIDTDGDGIPNYQDTDSDGDGILDSVEKGPNPTPVDTDLDGTPDYLDLDSDADGIPDATEGALDTDSDGIPNFRDLDSDGDGILDAVEGTTDTDADGIPNYLDTDSDGDGISDAIEKGPTGTPVDTDGDGTPDYKDLDSDNDGILDSEESATDTDSDGIPNFRDLDSDGDGILDAIEGSTDSDGDGTPNYRDVDSDGDGIPDSIEKGPGSVPVDTDGDGTPDYLDLDSDGDGIPDAVEDAGCTGTAPCTPTDTDGDGTPNFRDLDSDGDGLTDAVEKGPNGATPVDTDGDTTPDYLDVDSDGDGISDAIEKGTGTTPLDTDGDGTPDYRDTDSDNDGILDSVEKGTGTSPVDTDNDGTPDYRDLDSDGDGKSDQSEGTVDTDNDGTPNYLDLDSDGDGVLDAVDVCPLINGLGSTNGCPPDSDGDGLADVDDSDDDNDGILDTVEAAACSPSAATCDTDGDGIPNILDTDSDGDGISDVIEAGGTDADRDGKADGAPDVNGIPASASGGLSPPNTDGTGNSNPYDTDSDGDGILDAIEKGTGATLADTDNDLIPDYLETDSDDDGISDAIEKGTGTAVADTDNDGIPDYRDLDSDGDGIPDSIEKGSGSTPVDTDGDGIPNFRDVDSDGDGILDSVEDAACSGITPCTPTDTDGDNTPDYLDLDSDADGIPDAIEGTVDTDRDGLPDYLDTDSDGDGILDSVEDAGCTGTMPCTPTDTDGDGIPNFRDLDSDGDGITDAIEGTTNTDGDLLPNYLDPDSDGDGISDLIEGNVDSDGDGTPNYKDLDSDGDGIPDAIEKGTTTAPVDTDSDGTPDYLDTDTDGDGIPDSVEDYGCTGTAPCTPTDTDGDGIPNHKDLDSDNDGIPDSVEKGSSGATPDDTDGTGLPNYLDTDSDDDGILDAVERGIDGNNPLDTDGDGTPDYKEVDSDGDGIPDAVEKGSGSTPLDTDGDGIPDYRDTDSDNDGILDATEDVGCTGTAPCTPTDTDNDGTPNYRDLDSDGDNKSDQSEGISDFDGDGTPNYLDLDSDGDNVLDSVDQCPLLVGLVNLNGCPVDTDGDGVYDIDDADDDNDGLLDTVEAAACTPTAVDCDTDGDGIPNRIDPDSDNDGISDVRESNGTDVDGDGRVDGTVDVNGVPSSTNGGLTPPNTDGTTLPDPYDTDSDGDGITDSLEGTVDTDGDGIPNYRDLDSDADGIPDSVERGTGAAILDTDGDGIPDYKDLDSDNDGILDTVEKGPNGATPLDTDGDGIPNYRDLDSDGDGIPDSIEKGTGSTLLNSDGDTLPDYLDTDSDGDGISDAIEKGLNGNSPIDTDGDGIPDYRDTDSDNDGIPDSVEKGTGTTPVDTDGDGVPNYRDLDSDGDGITDAVEKGANGATPVDTDSDGSPDYVDLDSDGDGKFDAIEKGTGSTLLDTDRDGIPDYRDVDNYGQPDVNVTDVNVPVVGNVKTNDAVPAGTTYGQPAAIAGATLVMDPATGTYTFTSSTPGTYVYLIPVCGPNQTTNCPLTPLQITVLDPLAVDKPVANTDFAILEQGGSATVAILANDTAGDLGKTIDATSLVILTAPAHGSAVVNSDGTITYTPSPFFVGVDSLEYRVCDTNNPAQCQTATVYFTVEPAGLVVKTGAVDDFAIVRASPDGSANVTGNVLSNDLNGAGATLTANLVTGPTTAQGTFTLNANGTYSFTPAAGFSGPVDIVYEACGGSPVVCTKATLHILVEPMPTLVNDTNTAFANVPKAGDLSTNDTKPAGTTYGQPAQQAGATLTVNADGTYSITATATGTYTYTIPVCAPGQVGTCPTQTLVVTVTAPSPVNDTNTAFANVPKTGDLSTNDTNPAGTTYGQPAQQAGATLTVNADGTYSITATAAGTYTYTIPVCAPGQTVNCPTQTLEITVTAPSLVNDTNTAFGNVPKAGNLATNDTNPVGSTYGQPAQLAGATLTVNADGTYSFTATAAGTYTYTIPVCAPGQTVNCPTQTLTITVTAPVLVNDTNTAFANVPKTGNLATNDTNPAGSTYGQPAQQAGATLTVNADGTYSFNATAAGTYTYTIPVCAPGQTLNCPTQTLTITVTAPSLVNDTNTAFANVPKTGNLSTNDTNPAGSTYGQPAQQAGATLTVNTDGTYSFNATAAGTYTYTVPVCAPGQTVNCPTQTLTITVTAPSLVNDTNTALANVPKTGDLSTNDTNPAGSTYGQPAQQAGASLTVNADGTYSFTATAAGTYTYTIPVCAPGQTSNCPTQTLTITVTAPSLVNDTNTAFANVPKTGNLATNDTNPAGSTYGQPAQQAGATLTVNADGTYSFSATAGGTYTYTIPVCAPGQTVNCPTQTLVITVEASSPTNDTNTSFANVPKTGDLSTNDTNSAGTTYGQPAQQTGATLTVNADGTYSFTATAVGTYSYTIPVCAPGQTANCPTQTLTITVTAPSPVNDTNTAFANVPKTGDLSTNDTNPAGTTYGQPAQQTGATLTVNADGTYSFTATAVGTFTYTIPVCAPGQTANCPTQTLVITVTAPSPANDINAALPNTPRTGDLAINDTNPAGSTYGQPAQQTGATLTVNPDGTYNFVATVVGFYTYTIPLCAPGQTLNCPTQTLAIKVTSNSIVAGIDNFQANQINGLTGGVAGNVLDNDEIDGKPIKPSQVVITVKDDGGLTGVVIDKDGNLILPVGVARGIYVLVYIICDVVDPTNCREAKVIIEVFDPVDLSVTKLVEAPEWFEGDEFTYTIRVENRGKTTATNVVVTDKLPVGLRYVSSVSSLLPVTTQVTGQEITWTMTQLPIAGSTDITLTVKAAPIADGKEQILLNTAKVSSKEGELSPADNTSSVPVKLKVFFIPNTITPNGGGINDTFEIPGLGRYVSNELLIINRWGDQVFERKNYQNDWGAEGLVSGTYFYILKVTDENGKQISFKGFVEVVKERIR
jgi:gliding motility-associated-like protein